MTTYNTSSSGTAGSVPSSTSSKRSALDPNSTKPIFVYKVRSGAKITCERDLCAALATNPEFAGSRCSSKPIPRGASRVAVHTQDLWSDDEKVRYAHYPNSTSSIASVGLPREVYWRRMLMGHFQDLYIVSPDNSPSSSQDGSPEQSQHVSPSSTFKLEQEAA